jgi:hypothetical protein
MEDKAHTEAIRHFAEHLKQFPASHEAIDRLELGIAKIDLTANMAASKTTPSGNAIQADDDTQWHKSVELKENIFLCHRPVAGEVLRMFALEQRQALRGWTEDMSAQVQEFLTEKFPGQNLSRVTDSFMHRLTRVVSQR